MCKKSLICTLCAVAILTLMGGCAQTSNSPQSPTERDPFFLSMGRADGAEVYWEGHTDGYQPGTTETMRLAINNKTDQPWDGRFCVQLLEPMPSSAVILLAEQGFNLESSGGFAWDLSVDLPPDLAPGIHGLALVVHEPGGSIVNVTPVQVGDGERELFQGEWPRQAALDACPAPNSSAGDPTH
jgi:hypothetical protein